MKTMPFTRPGRCTGSALKNWRGGAEDTAGAAARRAAVDPSSSGIAFDGWRDHTAPFAWPAAYQPLPVAVPRSWLLTDGWRRHGPIDLREVPGPRP